MNEEFNQELLNEVLIIMLNTFATRFKHIQPSKLQFEDSLKEVTKGDLNETSHALLDIHEMLGLSVNYEPFCEYEKFKNFGDVALYFYQRLSQ